MVCREPPGAAASPYALSPRYPPHFANSIQFPSNREGDVVRVAVTCGGYGDPITGRIRELKIDTWRRACG